MKFYYNLCSVETTDIKSGGSGEHYKAGKSTQALKPKTTISSNRDRRVSVQGCVTLADELQNSETLIHINMRSIAKQICQYNGQKGTEKQIDKCLHIFKYDESLMKQFCNNRIG